MNKTTLIAILACLFSISCVDIEPDPNQINWEDGKVAWQYTSYSFAVWEKAGKTCPHGYNVLSSVCNYEGICAVVFRCKGVD